MAESDASTIEIIACVENVVEDYMIRAQGVNHERFPAETWRSVLARHKPPVVDDVWRSRDVSIRLPEAGLKASHVKDALAEAAGLPRDRIMLFIRAGEPFDDKQSYKKLRFDDSLCAYVCRVIDADGLEYCTRLQRRALELDRTCAIRGQFPDSGWQTWWLHLHPLTGDVTKELSKLFDGLPDVSTGGGPLPGKRVDAIRLAQCIFGYAAESSYPAFDVMLRPDKLRDYHLLSCNGTPRGSLSWQEFLSYWQVCEAQYAADAVKDATARAVTGDETDATYPTMSMDCLLIRDDWAPLKYRPPSVGVRPLTETEKSESAAKRRARREHRKQPRDVLSITESNTRHTGDWSEGGVPVTTRGLWDQRLSDSWRGIFDSNRSANPSQLTKIVEYYRSELGKQPRHGVMKLSLAMALYAENASSDSIAEAASLFKDAIDCNAHAGDCWTLYRAAMCLEDAGRDDDAYPLLFTACEGLKNVAVVRLDCGFAAWRLSETWDAINHWQLAWILQPTLALAQAWLGLSLFVKCYGVDKDDAILSPVQLLNPAKMTPEQLETAVNLRAKAAETVPVKTSRSSTTGQRLRVGDVHELALWHLRRTLAHGWSPEELAEQLMQWGRPLHHAATVHGKDRPDVTYFAELGDVLLAIL